MDEKTYGMGQPTFYRQVDMMIDGFMETFASPVFEGTTGQHVALELAKERGRQDIVERIEAPARRREANRITRELERERAELEKAEDERAEYERLRAKYEGG